MYQYSFTFLFNKFKQYYLHNIFPDFKHTTIYDPCLGELYDITVVSYTDYVIDMIKQENG